MIPSIQFKYHLVSTSHSSTDSQGIPKFREFQEYGYSPNNSWNSRNLHKQDSEFRALYFQLWGLDGGVAVYIKYI